MHIYYVHKISLFFYDFKKLGFFFFFFHKGEAYEREKDKKKERDDFGSLNQDRSKRE